MGNIKDEWNVIAIGASLKGGTIFEFKKKSNSNVAVTIYHAWTEDEAWKVLTETLKVTN